MIDKKQRENYSSVFQTEFSYANYSLAMFSTEEYKQGIKSFFDSFVPLNCSENTNANIYKNKILYPIFFGTEEEILQIKENDLEAFMSIVSNDYFYYYIKYVFSCVQKPYIEKLAKAGFHNLAHKLTFSRLEDKEIYLDESKRKLHKIFYLPQHVFKLLKEEENLRKQNLSIDYKKSLIVNFDTLVFFFYQLQQHNLTISKEDFEYLLEIGLFYSKSQASNFLEILQESNQTINQIISYIKRADLYQAMPPSQTIELYKDYLKMMNKMKLKYKKNPDSLYKEHALTTRQYNLYVKEHKDQILSDTLSPFKKYEYKDDNFIICLPKSTKDILREGNMLSHCVSSYVDVVLKGNSVIFFIRKKEHPDMPYYTFELNKSEVTQVRGKFNSRVEDDNLKAFIKKWASLNKFKIVDRSVL
ncbi:MAG: PcfJ domain-containing protein [Ignavibacterium sp.]|nr:PcfJ domain-containing protein [Ignavibacterium sp.]